MVFDEFFWSTMWGGGRVWAWALKIFAFCDGGERWRSSMEMRKEVGSLDRL